MPMLTCNACNKSMRTSRYASHVCNRPRAPTVKEKVVQAFEAHVEAHAKYRKTLAEITIEAFDNMDKEEQDLKIIATYSGVVLRGLGCFYTNIADFETKYGINFDTAWPDFVKPSENPDKLIQIRENLEMVARVTAQGKFINESMVEVVRKFKFPADALSFAQNVKTVYYRQVEDLHDYIFLGTSGVQRKVKDRAKDKQLADEQAKARESWIQVKEAFLKCQKLMALKPPEDLNIASGKVYLNGDITKQALGPMKQLERSANSLAKILDVSLEVKESNLPLTTSSGGVNITSFQRKLVSDINFLFRRYQLSVPWAKFIEHLWAKFPKSLREVGVALKLADKVHSKAKSVVYYSDRVSESMQLIRMKLEHGYHTAMIEHQHQKDWVKTKREIKQEQEKTAREQLRVNAKRKADDDTDKPRYKVETYKRPARRPFNRPVPSVEEELQAILPVIE